MSVRSAVGWTSEEGAGPFNNKDDPPSEIVFFPDYEVALDQNLKSFFLCYVFGFRWPKISIQGRFGLIGDVAVVFTISVGVVRFFWGLWHLDPDFCPLSLRCEVWTDRTGVSDS
jgi:hypothetical protein